MASKTYGTKTITTTATKIADGTNSRLSMEITNVGSVTVYLGDAQVTAASGYPLNPGDEYVDDPATSGAWYAIAASGSGEIRFMDRSGS